MPANAAVIKDRQLAAASARRTAAVRRTTAPTGAERVRRVVGVTCDPELRSTRRLRGVYAAGAPGARAARRAITESPDHRTGVSRFRINGG